MSWGGEHHHLRQRNHIGRHHRRRGLREAHHGPESICVSSLSQDTRHVWRTDRRHHSRASQFTPGAGLTLSWVRRGLSHRSHHQRSVTSLPSPQSVYTPSRNFMVLIFLFCQIGVKSGSQSSRRSLAADMEVLRRIETFRDHRSEPSFKSTVQVSSVPPRVSHTISCSIINYATRWFRLSNYLHLIFVNQPD